MITNTMPASNTDSDDAIVVENLSLAYGKQVIQKELNFIVQRRISKR